MTDFLPTGKLPTEFLGSLLETLSVQDDTVAVGPGIGRDAAVVEFGDSLLVLKTDPITFAVDSPARHLLNVNANDLLCLGAIPKWMLVTALFPAEATTPEIVAKTFADLQAASEETGVTLVGGHTEITDAVRHPVLVGMMIGAATRDSLVKPGESNPGDRLIVAGPIAAEGTAILANTFRDRLTDQLGNAVVQRASGLIDDPGFSVRRQTRAIAEITGVTGLHDPTEGGLATGIRELAIASGCGAVVNPDLVPIHAETKMICDELGIDPLGLIASGTLLIAATAESAPRIIDQLKQADVESAIIGKLMVSDNGFAMVDSSGEPLEFPQFDVDELARISAAN